MSEATFSAFSAQAQLAPCNQGGVLKNVDVGDDDIGSLICEKAGTFRSDTLTGASNNCYLTSQEAMRKVEV
jgi:hypothetical protein